MDISVLEVYVRENYSLFAITYGNGGYFNCSITIQGLWYMYDGFREYNCTGSGLKKKSRNQCQDTDKAMHFKYVLREIK